MPWLSHRPQHQQAKNGCFESSERPATLGRAISKVSSVMTSQRFFMKYRGLDSDQGRQSPYHALYWPANLRTLPRLRHISQHNPRLLSTMKLHVPSLTKLVALHPTAAKHQISTFKGTTVHPKVMLGHHCTLDTLALRLETSVLTGTEKAPARNSWHPIKKTASQNPKTPLHSTPSFLHFAPEGLLHHHGFANLLETRHQPGTHKISCEKKISPLI